MTTRELYDYAKEKDILDYDIEAQHSDDGGWYHGSRSTDIDEVEIKEDIESIII